MLLTTKIALSDEQREYLEGLGIDSKKFSFIENDNFNESGLDINTLIKVLFTCSKYEDAWNIIKSEVKNNKLNFSEIFTCPYAQLDRDAVEVYKYMYDSNIIDKKSYMYFEVLSGKLNDWDFWKNEFEGKSTTEILMILNDSFNDIFVQENVNPYQVGLVELTDEQNKYIILDRIAENEKIDFIFDNKPSIFVGSDTILLLLLNENLDKKYASKYFKIVLEEYTHTLDIEDKNNYNDYKNFWNFVLTYTSTKLTSEIGLEEAFSRVLKDMELDTLQKILNLCNVLNDFDDNFENGTDYLNEYGIDFSNVRLDVCINNPLMLNYPYTILQNGLCYPLDIKIDIGKVLDDKNLGLVLSYALHPNFDVSKFIIKYPFPGGCAMIYSKVTDCVLIDTEYKPYSKDLFGFIDDYIIANSINDELFKKFNSEKEYGEFIISAKNFVDRVNVFRDEVLTRNN